MLKALYEPLFCGRPSAGELHSPYLSPVYGEYEDLPPVFISVSDSEALFDDSRELYKKLSSEGHKVQLDIGHGVCHAFQVFPMMPEARRSIRHTFEFLEKLKALPDSSI